MEKFIQNLDEILTYDKDQLIWIMLRGTEILKQNTLTCWIKNGDLDVFPKVMDFYDFSDILLDFLMDEFTEQSLAQRLVWIHTNTHLLLWHRTFI